MIEVIPKIGYEQAWADQIKDFDRGEAAASYWNRRCHTFENVWRTSTYAGDLLDRMMLGPECSVLDVACGSGTVAIPMAKNVGRVTALDISEATLHKLRRKIRASGLRNISIVKRDWNEVVPCFDIARHDVALLSRSVMINKRLSETLRKLNLLATSTCYITWRAERGLDEYDTAVANALGKRYSLYPDYRVIYGLLRQMGIDPDIDIFVTTDNERYPSLETAVHYMAKGSIIDDRQRTGLLNVARDKLKLADGFYSITRKTKWAVVGWRIE